MVFTKYKFPLPNNGDRYDLSTKDLVEILDKVYDNGFEHARDLYDPSRQPTTTSTASVGWAEYQREAPKWIDREKTDIKCPKCGKNIKRVIGTVLTTYPPQYRYECDCGWTEIGYK